MTLEEAKALVTAETSFNAQDVDDFFACSDAERALLVQAYKDAGQMREASDWDVFIRVMGTCAQIAGMLAPMVAVVSGVYGIAKAASS